jgi:hypothetical protein
VLGLGAGVRTGLLPGAVAWPYAKVGVRWSDLLSAELRTGVGWPQSTAVAEGQLRFAAYSLALAGCVSPLRALPNVSLCAEVHAGLLHASAHGLYRNFTRNDLVLSLATRVEYELVALQTGGRVSLWADLGRTLVQPRFVVFHADGKSTAASLAPSDWAAGAGLLYAFFL